MLYAPLISPMRAACPAHLILLALITFVTWRRLIYHQVWKLILIKMKMAVLWDVAPCSLVETDRRFRGAYCLHHQGRSVSIRLHGSTFQKTAIFMLVAVRTWNHTWYWYFHFVLVVPACKNRWTYCVMRSACRDCRSGVDRCRYSSHTNVIHYTLVMGGRPLLPSVVTRRSGNCQSVSPEEVSHGPRMKPCG
jgi:hypothetical protein